jgi:SAM-dependent methyltransferase
MTTERQRASATGGRTLEVFANTPRLNQWLFSKLSSGVRGDTLEIGSGIGNISRLIRPQVSSLVVTDTEPHNLQDLESCFRGDEGVQVAAYDLDGPPPPAVATRSYDSIVAVNVIEHIADDRTLVSRLAGLLRPGGRLLIYVPACPVAFGSLDTALGHYRRYTPATLTALLRAANLDPGQPRYVNLLGLAGWLFNGRVLKQKAISPGGVALFERLMPLVRIEDRIRLPFGLGLCTQATKVG